MSSAQQPTPVAVGAGPSVKRSSRLHAVAKRSARTILDADARRHARATLVATLEQDNHIEEADEEYKDNNDGDDADEQILVGAAASKAAKGAKGGKGKAAGKRKAREGEAEGGGGKGGKGRKARVSLLELVEKLGMREAGAAEPNYVTATSSPPTHPPRSFCSVCGYLGCYTCGRCGMRYCSIGCQRTHNETTCVKFDM